MKSKKYLISLTTADNDYQLEQAAAAEEAARRLGLNIQIIYAENDSVNQSQQLLQAVQAPKETRPGAIIFEPVGGTALPQVARAAAEAGIAWVVLNHEVTYIAELRKSHASIPIFEVTSDHEEIGRIQGRQFAKLLPKGGHVLYIQGPSESSAAKQRTAGMQETKPASVRVSTLRANWTEASSTRAVAAWLRLATSNSAKIDVVGAQDDSMAMGARKALKEGKADRDRWSHLLFTGCDGLPKTGQAWVRQGVLAATVIVPANTGMALEMLVEAGKNGSAPPERALTKPVPFPAL